MDEFKSEGSGKKLKIAFYLWLEGRSGSEQPLPVSDKLPYLVGITGDAYKIYRRDFKRYLTNPVFTECFNVWWFWSKHGTLPYAGGIMDQPHNVISIIKMFEGCRIGYKAYRTRMGG